MALIYILEDDPDILEIEKMALKNSNYIVKAFDRPSSFFKRLKEVMPDLVLLDVMLPEEDGYSVVNRIRNDSKTGKIPVIMISAKTEEIDMLKGLDNGADDYIKKPFSVMELLSRVRALLRRSQQENTGELLKVGDIILDNERHTVSDGNRNIILTLREYELLRYLMINEDIVLGRESLMYNVWGSDFEGESRTVDMHIKTLRQKLGDAGRQIHTVRGVGYSISSSGEQQ